MNISLVLEKIYKEYFNLFFSIGYRYRLDKETIEDKIQEAFEKAFSNKEKIRGTSEAEIRTYVIRIFRNQCLLYLRSGKRQGNKTPYDTDMIDIRFDPLHEILIIEEMRLQRVALSRIEPLKYREPVALYLEGYKPRDIAVKIKKNGSTTRNLIHRGLKIFEAIMKKMDPLRKL